MKFVKELNSDQNGYFEILKPKNFLNTPTISIVMSVYNGQKYLCESIDSILNQTFINFEFIIINDGSKDNTLDIIIEYQSKDNRILIINQENIGLTLSLNRGIKVALSEYIARQDADDISLPTRLAKQFIYLENHPEVAVIGCLEDVFNTNGSHRKMRDLNYSPKEIKQNLPKKNPISHGSVMMRKSSLEKVGFYRGFFLHAQDYDLWLRISQSFDIAILPEHLYRYRVTREAISISRKPVQKQYADIARKFHSERLANGQDSYDKFIRSCPDGLPACDDTTGEYEYHLLLAREFIGSNKLKDARKKLRYLWELGCRTKEIFYLLLICFMGVKILNLLRHIKEKIFKIKEND